MGTCSLPPPGSHPPCFRLPSPAPRWRWGRAADRPSAATVEAIIAHHATPQQAGELFRRIAPRLAVYSHAPANMRVLAETRTTYAGPLQGAEDLLTILIGAKIEVVHLTTLPP